MADSVNHPPHYDVGGTEVIDVIEAWQLGFHAGNVVKYVARSQQTCESIPKQTGVLAIVITPFKLVQIGVRMLRAQFVVGTNNGAVERRPRAFNGTNIHDSLENEMSHSIGCFWIGKRETPLTAEQINQRAAKLMEGIKMTVRCKFVCNYKEGQNVHFYPVYSGSEENNQFFAEAPDGHLSLFTVKASALEQFEVGKEYYIDLTPAGS